MRLRLTLSLDDARALKAAARIAPGAGDYDAGVGVAMPLRAGLVALETHTAVPAIAARVCRLVAETSTDYSALAYVKTASVGAGSMPALVAALRAHAGDASIVQDVLQAVRMLRRMNTAEGRLSPPAACL